MYVISTRDAAHKVFATQAVLKGISPDGGLYVPEYFPRLDMQEMLRAAEEGYETLSAKVLGMFLDIEEEDLLEITRKAYNGFDTREIVPLSAVGKGEYVMELYHGPTLAFKDMALQVLPRLISSALELHNQQEDVLVLTATSGDTGKAALEGFRDVPRTAIQVFYPEDGVADMQRLQMVTQEGGNTDVCAVKGNFDDAQTGVKALFADTDFAKEVEKDGYMLSSANSINFGRLIPQVAYYVYAYAKLVNNGAIFNGDKVNFCVPTGNFGNILAAYYAKRMGIPVNKLICASNKNNVLTDFFNKGVYDANRKFHKTMSPSMDILISSNLERLLLEMTDRDDSRVCVWMESLKGKGTYSLPEEAREHIENTFYADYCTEKETAQTIRDTFAEYNYLMDTHSAVGQCVYRKYLERTGDETVTVVVSTANPYKFTQDVLQAVTGENEQDAFAAAEKLQKATKVPIPPQISELKEKTILHSGTVAQGDQISATREFLKRLAK